MSTAAGREGMQGGNETAGSNVDKNYHGDRTSTKHLSITHTAAKRPRGIIIDCRASLRSR